MRKPPQSKRGGPGKRPQRFTQRNGECAHRAAPDRIIRICGDGTLELAPIESAASVQHDRGDGNT